MASRFSSPLASRALTFPYHFCPIACSKALLQLVKKLLLAARLIVTDVMKPSTVYTEARRAYNDYRL